MNADTHRLARGRMVIIDADVLLDFIDASKQLRRPLEQLHGDSQVDRIQERWEIAHTTLCGNVRSA